MSALITSVSCKRCSAKIEIPPLPQIVGETAEQKAIRIGALELGTILKHLTKEHPEARPHMIAWANVFSEFYFLAAFELKDCQVLLDRYDAQRLLLLGLCQRDAGTDGVHFDSVNLLQAFYEETQRIAELEKAGYTITRGFLGEKASKVTL